MNNLYSNTLKLILALSLMIMLSTSAFAKRFSNQYTEFELPTGWSCALEGTEWVCQSSDANRKKEAIIILAAKVRGSQDSLDQYQDYLNNQKTFTLPGGKNQVSEPKYTKVSNINNHRWVDALHLASEVPGFYTRYLATVKADLGVAVTFSVGKDYYSAYQSIFDNIVSSLRVFRQANKNMAKFVKKKEENLLGDGTFAPEGGAGFKLGGQKKGKKKGGMDDQQLYIIAGAVGLGLVLLLLKKKGN